MLEKRQPIVTVLGHVDHGKTSLLDALRSTNVQIREAGGITQSIGASVVGLDGDQGICFIDTPGHALFSGMRQRGATIADIALLIVDGSAGIKPQTKEAISYILESKIPYIVVITKTDLSTSSIENTLGSLESEGIYFEGRGGQIPYIGVSAREKKNLKELLDLITLLSEVNSVSGDKDSDLEAYVIETTKEKAGTTVSVVVKNGTLKVGQEIFTSTSKGKIRGLFDSLSKPQKEILPGYPAKILGFESMPEVGARVFDKPVETIATQNKKVLDVDENKFPLVIKATSLGALEALRSSVPEDFLIIDASVGDPTESDILSAKASSARVFVFESKISPNIKKLAEAEGVEIESFDVIYKLLEKLDEIVNGAKVQILGKAEIIAEFPFDNKRVAGSKVVNGTISKKSKVKIYRGDNELGEVKIISIKKQKQEVDSVSQGEECGILFVPQLDFQKGDSIVSTK